VKFDIEQTKKDIIRKATEVIDRLKANNARQVDSINRLLGHVQDGTSPVRAYEHELMDLNDRLAKADVQMAAYLDIIIRVRQHAQSTGNDRLLEIVGDVGKEVHDAMAGAVGARATGGATLGTSHSDN
jgi:hypothetical protein